MNENNLNNRNFKLWFYHVTHNEALIRSPKNDVYDNIDIYFADIKYIEVPSILTNLHIDKATKEDVEYLSKKIENDITIEDIKVMISEKHRYYIVASVMKIMENDLELFELPFYTFMKNQKDII